MALGAVPGRLVVGLSDMLAINGNEQNAIEWMSTTSDTGVG
jgi:hypothetical protein